MDESLLGFGNDVQSSEKFSNVDEDDIGGSTPDGLELDVQLDLPQNGTGIRFVQLLLLFSYQLKVGKYFNETVMRIDDMNKLLIIRMSVTSTWSP